MAKVKILTQGLVENHEHECAINNLIKSSWTNKIFISVAFVRSAGVIKLADELQKKHTITEMFIGISNGITSKQALSELLSIGIQPYLIDMGTQKSIFHPKIYAAIGETEALVILGSANLTSGGLNNNIEISSLIELDLNNEDDRQYILSLTDPFTALVTEYPQNIFKITTNEQLTDLVNQGRIEDESIRKLACTTGSKVIGAQSIAIPTLPIKRISPVPVPTPTIVSIQSSTNQQGLTIPIGLVWSSKELTERDLSIPTGTNTNPTGSMNFKKGLLLDIDQRHYFKDVIFSSLTWTPDTAPEKRHLLRAEANFEIIINGISNGTFLLRLTHNSNTESRTYRQNNAMTQIHWGDVKPIISKPELLGKHMSLFFSKPNNYQIEIT